MFRALFVAGVLLAVVPQLSAQTAPPLATAYDHLKESIRPSPAELAFARIRWRPTLGSAVEEARERGRPVLLWTMNGHPLGCT
ncbi:MAG: hypothetical protein ACYTDY_10545 [Planctomycetota bacterium]|jgi:hypothetical protein